MEAVKILQMKYPRYVKRMQGIFLEATGCELLNKNLTAVNLMLFTNKLKECVANSSAHTYSSFLKSAINTLKADGQLRQLTGEWEKSLNVKAEQVAMCYLTEEEINKFAEYVPKNDRERVVQAQFLIECYTGARTSDIERFDRTNIDGDFITYVSQKTRIRATIPLKPIVRRLIEENANKGGEMPLKTKNEIIRRICMGVGITDVVKVFRAGEELTGEKYKFCSTHTGRRSFASNMYLRGVDLYTISKLMGHSSVQMTENYIVCGIRDLPEAALNYFK